MKLVSIDARKLTRLAVIGCAAVLIAGGTGGSIDSATGTSVDIARPHGIGERIVLVVAASVPSDTDVAARAKTINASFGHLQGFFTDPGDAYDITGVYVQTTPQATRLACRAGTTFEGVVAGAPAQLECPDNASMLKVLPPIRLRYVERFSFDSSDFPEPCGAYDVAPCQRDRYARMLGPSLRFEPGRMLVVTAFRTKAGAQGFLELARSAGVDNLVVVQATKLGGGDVGLGQEPHPDGSGPLTGPLPDPDQYQR